MQYLYVIHLGITLGDKVEEVFAFWDGQIAHKQTGIDVPLF